MKLNKTEWSLMLMNAKLKNTKIFSSKYFIVIFEVNANL